MRLAAPLKDRDFALLTVGTLTSLIGDGVYLVAIAFATLKLSPGPGALSIVGTCFGAGTVIFILLGGVLADRLNKRHVLIAGDVLRLVALTLVSISAFTGHLSVWQLAVLAFLYGSGDGIAAPAISTIVAEVIDDTRLAAANALMASLRPIAHRLVGPVLGGLIFAWLGTGGAFLFDAITFAISTVCLIAMRGHRPDLAEQQESVRRQLTEAGRYVTSQAWLWGTLIMAAVVVFAFIGPFEVLLPVLVKEHLSGSATEFGIVLGGVGVGNVIGSLAIGHYGIPRREMLALFAWWGLDGLAIAAMGLAGSSWLVALFGFVGGVGSGVGTAIWMMLILVRVPEEMRGRVSSLDWLLSLILMPASFALTGPVAALIGVRETIVASGLLAFGLTVITYAALPKLRAENGSIAAIDAQRARAAAEAAQERPMTGAI